MAVKPAAVATSLIDTSGAAGDDVMGVFGDGGGGEGEEEEEEGKKKKRKKKEKRSKKESKSRKKRATPEDQGDLVSVPVASTQTAAVGLMDIHFGTPPPQVRVHGSPHCMSVHVYGTPLPPETQ